MMDNDCEISEAAEEPTSPQALCHSIIFFCSKGMIEGVVVFLFIWLLIQVLLNKHQEVHLQVLLGAGLALLCFCLLLGCAICWHRSRRRPSAFSLDGGSKELSPQRNGGHELTEAPSMSAVVPIPFQYQDMDLNITPKSGEDMHPAAQHDSDSIPRSSLHARASLPSLYQLSSKTKRVLQRRSTVFGDSSLPGDQTRLVRVPHSYTEPDGLSGVKQKSRPLLHFTVCYSQCEEVLNVTVTGLSNLAKRYQQKRDPRVRAYLLPGFIEPQSSQREGPGGWQRFSFWRYSPEKLKNFTLRLAVYSRERHSLREVFIGEVLFSCAQSSMYSQGTSGYTKEMSTTKTKLKKSLSTMDVLTAPSSHSRSLGQIFILLQYQALSNRIKVMVQKAENLGKLTRIPGAPDHVVYVRLSQGKQVQDMKETRSVSGFNPVWNAPFLFDVSPGAEQDQTLRLEFLVMQGRLYNRARVLGRVLIGAGASEAGMAHWKEMCMRQPVECARWHALQPDVF